MKNALVSFCNQTLTPNLGLALLDLDGREQPVWIASRELAKLGGSTGVTDITGVPGGYMVAVQHPSRALLLRLSNSLDVIAVLEVEGAYDVHGLAADEEAQTLFVVSTGTDQVFRVQLNSTWEQILSVQPFWAASVEGTSDQHHVNSIAQRGDDLLVTNFGPSNHTGWHDAASGSIINLTTGETLLSGLQHPHSLRADAAGDLWFLESATCQLIRLTREGRVNRYFPDGNYLRGLMLHRDTIHFASSAYRRRSRSQGTANGTSDESPRSYEAILHLATHDAPSALRAEFPLTGMGSEIFAIHPFTSARPGRATHEQSAYAIRARALEELSDGLRKRGGELERLDRHRTGELKKVYADLNDKDKEAAALRTSFEEDLVAVRQQLENAEVETTQIRTERAITVDKLSRAHADLETLRLRLAEAQSDLSALHGRRSVQAALKGAHLGWLTGQQLRTAARQLSTFRGVARKSRTAVRLWRTHGAAHVRSVAQEQLFSGRAGPSPTATQSTITNQAMSSDRPFDPILLPTPSETSIAELTARAIPTHALTHDTILLFSAIDWDFRFQRPQQLARQFAATGHRVFYVSQSKWCDPATKAADVREVEPNVFHIRLAVSPSPDVYADAFSGTTADQLLESLRVVRTKMALGRVHQLVQFPAWHEVAVRAREMWGWSITFDCMDDWSDMPRVGSTVLEAEFRLVDAADAMTVSSTGLLEKWAARRSDIQLVRNATDLSFFTQECKNNKLLLSDGRPIIGYYGAIAPWFDVPLVAEVARAHPEWRFVLVGAISDVDVQSLRGLQNVELLGERPYADMPGYLWHFDVCLIPFVLSPVTKATDPVKVYEYLSSGKPVVSTRLPELESMVNHVYQASGSGEFGRAIEQALSEMDGAQSELRREFAGNNTWSNRLDMLRHAILRACPTVSIVMVTYGNLPLTKLAVETVLTNTGYASYELIIIDNASTDGTQRYLQTLSSVHSNINIVLNEENKGFAAANNQGLNIAGGDIVVFLNNDTAVPPGWLRRLISHLADGNVGAVGPVTNSIGNEARIDVPYTALSEMEIFAHERASRFDGLVADIPMLALYCAAVRREVLDVVGHLDERFGIGMFEDDDFSTRVHAAGWRIVCAADSLVHHVGGASFNLLKKSGAYQELFARNQRLFEQKWGTPWTPHAHGRLEFRPHH